MLTTAVVAGLGPGFCERFAERLAADGYDLALLGRSADYLEEFAEGLGDDGHEALAVPTDVTEASAVADAFARIHEDLGPVEVLGLTASTTTRDEREELHPDRFEKLWRLYTRGSLLCFNEAREDLRETGGTVLFFGASEDTGDAAYRSAKDAARGLARSLADDYGPDGIHVAHVVIGGAILNPDVREAVEEPDPAEYLDPDAVAATCMHLVRQHSHTQTFEVDLRPGVHGLY